MRRQLTSSRIVTPLLVLAICASLRAEAGTFDVLYSFHGKNGSEPKGELISDASGNLYGTTAIGGTAFSGTVFKLAPDGSETVLLSFCPGDRCAAGSEPGSGLVMDDSGNLYGTTIYGGPNADGVAFELAPDGSETVLHTFLGGSDGEEPMGKLIRTKKGYLFGTTVLGGGDGQGCGGYGCGTVFSIAPDGTETVLHAFSGGNDGAWPYAGLVADADGALYGTASYGGVNNAGVVFELTTDGSEKVLHSFGGGRDGRTPVASLYKDGTGNLYGTTEFGGRYGRGTVFKLAPDGTETVLHAFEREGDGSFPDGALTSDGKGNFFGTTTRGGLGHSGTIFEISGNGSEKVLYDFQGDSDGKSPVGGVLVQAGSIYGTTELGGMYQHGVAFKLLK
jgi:uncharacterized repeat protein (TIGR03803 family)